jgi:transposase
VLRIIGAGWGNMTGEWVGKSLVLYCDPTVVYAGKEVGGIRIQAMSNIVKRLKISLSKTRGKKIEHIIDILAPVAKPQYPAAQFDKAIVTMAEKINDGSMTAEQVINRCEATGWLTDEQKQQIRDIEKGDADLVIEESVNDFFNDKEVK